MLLNSLLILRVEKHAKIKRAREVKRQQKEEADKKKAEARKKKEAKIAFMQPVTDIVKAAGFCQRVPASINQAKQYLKLERFYKPKELSHLDEVNIVTEFQKLCAARPPDIVIKLKAEAGSNKKRKSQSQSQKVKTEKRKRKEESAPRKKPRIQSREVEQQGKVLDLEDTIVKTESDVN